MSEQNGETLDLSAIDFTPAWARKEAGVTLGRQAAKAAAAGEEGERRAPGSPRPPKRDFKPRREFRAPEPPLEAEVKVLPETKALGTIIRKLQQDFHAYKLKDLAFFFLDNPESVLLKISPKPGAAQPVQFYQCKACGFASTSEGEVLEHILAAHLGDYYDTREIEVEPPKGNFNCVARCGLSGVLLGPPNQHEFNSIVREMIRTRYPEMSEADYRARLEIVREPEVIEEWRRSAVKKTVFIAKGAPDGEAAVQLSRSEAEGEFRRTLISQLIDRPKLLMITAAVALKSPVRSLQRAAREALEAERRAPYAMTYALRGAFHHRKLKFFRVNDVRGQEFVTGVELKEFDAEHAIAPLAALARFIEEHPCCDKSEFPAGDETEQHLNWLVSTGHVVAFTNGVYSKVEKFPKYGPQWKKRPEVKNETPDKLAE